MNITVKDVKTGPLIYQSPDGANSIFKAKVRDNPKEFIVKMIKIKDDAHENQVLNELTAQKCLKHRNLVKLLMFFKMNNPSQMMLLMKFYNAGDVNREIISRQPNNHFTEDALMNVFKSLIEAFAYLQSKGFAHRDIKPQNILISNQGVYKIVDFGAIKEDMQYIDAQFASNYTIQGTPTYLSPKLRKAYTEYLSDHSRSRVEHNPIKSDVYSLGMTFLAMACLEEPKHWPHSMRTSGRKSPVK